jgi:hypothetical protein
MIRASVESPSTGDDAVCGVKSQPSVRAMAVGMIHEDGDRAFEMLAIQDEQPVETFVTDGSHETLGDGIGVSRRLHRRRAVPRKRSESRIRSIRCETASSD